MESPNNASQPVVVDDASQNQWLTYNGEDWTHLFGLSAPANGTLTYTTTVGSNIVFTFNGTAVGVAGTIVPANNGATPPTTTYSIDGTLLETYTPPTNITQQTNAISFFVKNSLSPTTHTLTINVTSINVNAPYLIDYIAYLPLPASPTSSTGPSPTDKGSPPGQNAPPAQSSSSSTPVGAIVGGVVGGVVLIALTILAFWWFLRKKRREEYIYDTASAADILHPETAQYGNTPSSFNQPPFDPTVGAYPYASQTQVSGTDELPLGYTEPFIGAQLAQVPSRTSFHGQPPLSGKAAAMQQAQTPEEPAIYHSDSGVRFTPAGPSSSDSAPEPAPPPPPTVLSDDIPPLYTEH